MISSRCEILTARKLIRLELHLNRFCLSNIKKRFNSTTALSLSRIFNLSPNAACQSSRCNYFDIFYFRRNGKSLSWMGLTRERWCCTRDLVSRLDMNTCQTSIKTDILI